MPDINALKASYFFQSADAQQLPGTTIPQTFSDSKITPLIDCAEFNQAIESALATVGQGADALSNTGDFVFIANWWLGLSGGSYHAAKLLGPGLQVVDDPRADASPYTLDGQGGTKRLTDILKRLAQLGVDVRVLGWVSLGVMDVSFIRTIEAAQTIARINALTIQSIKDLREEPQLEKKAVMNVIAHAAGGVHTKCVIIGNNSGAIGFTGGLDFQMGRWAHMYHTIPPADPSRETWHDVVAKIEGPAVVGLYDWYKDIWNENVSRSPRHIRFEGQALPSYVGPGANLTLAGHTFATPPQGKHHVQSLRTVPQFNYKPFKIVPTPGPLSFAPDGLFEFRCALQKAIENAQIYIYMEDQSFWSREVMEWVNDSLLKRPQLRVILLAPGGADPNDPRFSDAILCNSINEGLFKHTSQNEEDQIKSQVAMFKRVDEKFIKWFSVSTVESGELKITNQNNVSSNQWSPAPDGPHSRVATDLTIGMNIGNNFLAAARYEIRSMPARFAIVGNDGAQMNTPLVLYVKNMVTENPSTVVLPTIFPHELVLIPGITVHSKTTLIDDHWGVIGSANIMRRSLYTDIEHCVSFVDEDDVLVKEYRKMLWDDHFRHGVPAHFDNIQESLHAWEPMWGTSGLAPARPAQLEKVNLPIKPNELLQGRVLRHYNRFDDPDSRQDW